MAFGFSESAEAKIHTHTQNTHTKIDGLYIFFLISFSGDSNQDTENEVRKSAFPHQMESC